MESTDSPEIPDRGKTSDILASLQGEPNNDLIESNDDLVASNSNQTI